METVDQTNKNLIARRALVIETVTFLLGLLFAANPENGIYYYIFWLCTTTIANVALIIWLIIKKPENYLLYGAWLLLLPMAYIIILCLVVGRMIN